MNDKITEAYLSIITEKQWQKPEPEVRLEAICSWAGTPKEQQARERKVSLYDLEADYDYIDDWNSTVTVTGLMSNVKAWFKNAYNNDYDQIVSLKVNDEVVPEEDFQDALETYNWI